MSSLFEKVDKIPLWFHMLFTILCGPGSSYLGVILILNIHNDHAGVWFLTAGLETLFIMQFIYLHWNDRLEFYCSVKKFDRLKIFCYAVMTVAAAGKKTYLNS